MPDVRPGETKKSYINRCTRQLIKEEGRKPDQARAICETMWNDRNKKKGSTMNKIPYLMDSVINIPWAITKNKLHEIMYILQTKNIDTELFKNIKELQADFDNTPEKPGDNKKEEKPYNIIDEIAYIEIMGTLSKRMNIIAALSGGTSYEMIQKQINMAIEDKDVGGIFMHIDSPGGNVDGLFNTADLIFKERDIKPIMAYADGTMASAAYLLGSAASFVAISDRAAEIGSLGVIAVHMDESAKYEKEGIKPTIFSSGGYKKTGNPYEALSDDDKLHIQDKIDTMYTLLIDSVAVHRNISVVSILRDDLGNGDTFIGHDAVDIGLADEILTRQYAIERLKEMI
jgi:signal peptide peptidase SppA